MLKVYKVSAKKRTDELCLMTLKSDAKYEVKLICFKNDKNLVKISTRALESLKNLHFDFYAKYLMFELKKYRGVIFHDTEK